MCEVKKYGLIHDSFLIDIARAVNKVPEDFNAGFSLLFRMDFDIVRFWFPNLLRIVVSGDQLFLYTDSHDDRVICFFSDEIKAFKVEYDHILAEYNGECVDDKTKDMFELSVWEENKSSSKCS